MGFIKKIRQNKWFSFFSNIYVIVLTVFAVWMIFFDTNSLMTHVELEKEIDKLQKQKEYLRKEIEKDKEMIRNLENDNNVEKFAREEYYFKKDNEEIYIIEHQDSIDQSKKKEEKE
ncbi:FtsB family cell division protein [Sinomicrobium weinanense]|uniref:Septum formation initiator family protein n=1 Tax=Sinomicrobium weinanense TaxID=2842200 RepID=A0A926JV94_9FLAO|nr:septum formation initiator family protein [Sinomicrobium weinanense]MBC9797954.1 septum formation initiator family protein [Sinomicrobium weinanense]MBU3123110.1 septum formation initiator family protein [Sinomicrobium weinanense]